MMRNFIILALASLLVSLISLSRDLNELQNFVKVILLFSLLLSIVLFAIRKYWRDVRSVK